MIHGLRHTHASLLFEAVASIKEVQERLGHYDIQMTMNIYINVTDYLKGQILKNSKDILGDEMWSKAIFMQNKSASALISLRHSIRRF
jgi:hypothetical protein